MHEKPSRELAGTLVWWKEWTVTGLMQDWAVSKILDFLPDQEETESREHILASTLGITLNFLKLFM